MIIVNTPIIPPPGRRARKLAQRIVELLNSQGSHPVNLQDLTSDDEPLAGFEPSADGFAVSDDERDREWQLIVENDTATSLQEFMDSWLEANCKLRNWRHRKKLEEDANRMRLRLSQSGTTIRLLPWRIPRYRSGSTDIDPGYTLASDLFLEFLQTPYNASVRRCKRCQRYFLTGKKKLYCSRRCALYDHAAQAKQRSYRREQEEKRQRVEAAINRFRTMSPAQQIRKLQTAKSWKHYIAGESAVSVKFITILERKGELRIPDSLTRGAASR